MEQTVYLVGFIIGCVFVVVMYVYIRLIDTCARVRVTYAEF